MRGGWWGSERGSDSFEGRRRQREDTRLWRRSPGGLRGQRGTGGTEIRVQSWRCRCLVRCDCDGCVASGGPRVSVLPAATHPEQGNLCVYTDVHTEIVRDSRTVLGDLIRDSVLISAKCLQGAPL